MEVGAMITVAVVIDAPEHTAVTGEVVIVADRTLYVMKNTTIET